MPIPLAPARPSTAAGSATTEEGRAFLQQRLALYGKVTFLLSSGFLVAGNLLALASGARSPAELLGASATRWHLAITLTLGMLWIGCRRGRLSPALLGMIEVAAIVGAGGGFARVILARDFQADIDPYFAALPGLLAMTHVTIGRAILVPSLPSRTAVLTALAMLPMAVTGIVLGQTWTNPLPAIYAVLWSVAAVVLATVTSQVIFGLRREVSQARRLGQYTLVEKLGEGGMGEVYRASHALLRRPTAVKLLLPSRTGETAVHRFEREVQLTSQLTHPNTIAIYDYGRTPDGVFYYAMEYLEGLTLQELVREDGPQPPARVRNLLLQVCGSLQEAHGAGLIHRDIKPGNIILCRRGGLADFVKVVDFGLVKEIGSTASVLVTAEDTLSGTPLYLSPETITQADAIDGQADLYALGAVAYYLLCGQEVFSGRTLVEIATHHLHTQPVPPSERLGRTLPKDLEAAVMRLLEKDRARRPADAAELERLLAAADVGEWSQDDARAWWAGRAGRRKAAGAAAAGAARTEPGAHPSLNTIGSLRTIEVDVVRRQASRHGDVPPG